MKKVIFVSLVFMLLAQVASAFEIQRFYQSSRDHWRVLIETEQKVRLKCVVYDKSKNMLAVEEGILKPPADEMIIRVLVNDPGEVDSVNCLSN